MPEQDLYTLWETQAETGAQFRCATGENLTVISRGRRNDLAGPDFLDAVLLIDGRLVTGAVEMHLRESDWFAHGHQDDPAYDAVRLHLLELLDGSPRLPIPTLQASDILMPITPHSGSPDFGGRGMATEPGDDSLPGITSEILAELAWSRLLRRVTEIIRTESDLPVPELLRRVFIRRLFDALGYGASRSAMGQVAHHLLLREEALSCATFEGIAARIFAASGLPAERVKAAGEGLMSSARLHETVELIVPEQVPVWRYDTRPANAPERRLWGAAVLLHGIYNGHLLPKLFEGAVSGGFEKVARMLVVRSNRNTYIGIGRAREIVMNALIPALLAAGIISRSPEMIESICLLYRKAPALESNRIIRDIDKRYSGENSLAGGFWQQGAIEFHQRYLARDKSGLSFIAEEKNDHAKARRTQRGSGEMKCRMSPLYRSGVGQ